MNFCRFPKNRGPSGEIPRDFFIRRERHPAAFGRTAAFLDRVVEARGFAYKDVVQPFAIAEWLRGRKEFRILRIRRNLADVAMAMLELRWLYPASAASEGPDVESDMVSGLVLADHTLEGLSGVTVDYDDLVRDGTALSAALSRLYPKHKFPAIRFRNRQQRPEDAKATSRRNSPRYRIIERKIGDLRARLNEPVTSAGL